ncbi:SDR family NAD(P)-dependent oxidoreductase [Nocardioides halotolerans]|jgi:NAD(P)-dependent dehydrogenase (short-subunit alcohol dehydrogenase family)|uniref:SDR family NAD(P)-dependent oxidoreductase n=1 Tax=Nocardioides halotolerans TaxID=433660 RepID=UPI0004042447|nr:SDR family NAD(P)-dependent oxidoreductase [Nocardioides halotolerans]
MTTSRTTVLITGANQGLGAETAARLAERGWTVWLGARDTARGESAAKEILDARPDADVRVVQLDVTSDESVAAAYDEVVRAGTGLDVLVNNAGINSTRALPADTRPADFLPVFGVNLLGPVRVTNAFLPLLERSPRPRLVMVSSGLGSFAVTQDRSRRESTIWGIVYPSSKAALNMVTTMYAKSLPGVRVTAVDPGYTATSLNDFSGVQTVPEGAEPIIEACVADELPGGFIGRDGVVPW